MAIGFAQHADSHGHFPIDSTHPAWLKQHAKRSHLQLGCNLSWLSVGFCTLAAELRSPRGLWASTVSFKRCCQP